MIPGNALVLECPFCGAKKSLISIASGNTCGGKLWSDTKAEYPMLPEPSPIQKCPECGKFYFINQAKSSIGDTCSFEEGELSFEELKQAKRQFEDSFDINSKLDYKILLYIRLLYAYNDTYTRLEALSEAPQEDIITMEIMKLATKVVPILKGEALPEAPQEDISLITEIMNELLQVEKVDPILKGELLRELGRFDESIEQLKDVRINNPNMSWAIDAIIDHARQKDRKPFVLNSY